ncbi:MAG: DUF362 domain-containing protein [Candidatus Cloacimonetes bacterium]|nr:DUF362 domain-containing protein [Candidatus Cloacimonadota bacterium]
MWSGFLAHYIVKREKLRGDPAGSIVFNLGENSLFYKHPGEGRYYGADYNTEIINSHHFGQIQEYLICATPVLADVFINMPKLKTHKKTGVTLSLKNLVGINADKNWLPHHTEGSPGDGGDQYPNLSWWKKVEQKSVKLAQQIALRSSVGAQLAKYLRRGGEKVFGDTSSVIRSGNWHGNNTTWRMVLDLNRCLLYGQPDGSINPGKKKRYYSVIDGIIGMEGQGPMQGKAKMCGVVLVGTDPVVTDAVAARLMGFDWEKIPVIREGFASHRLPISLVEPGAIEIRSELPELNGMLNGIKGLPCGPFEPHPGWHSHIELK